MEHFGYLCKINNEIMATLAEQLKQYFHSTPKEELRKEWERIHSKFNFGPDAISLMEETNKLIESISYNKVKTTNKVKYSFDKRDTEYCLAA